MHIQIIISIRLYRAQCLHGMRYPYLLLLLNFVRLSLMSGCIFKLAQLLLFYVPVHVLLHEPFIEKKQKKTNKKKKGYRAVGLARSEIIVQLALAVPSFYPQLLLLNVIVSLLTMWIKLILSPK